MVTVEKWLSGQKNFYVGRSIYLAIGTDARLKSLLQLGKTDTSQKLLEAAMQNLVSQPSVSKPLKKEVETVEMPDSDDRILKSIRNEWIQPYQEMNYKRHQLDQFPNDDSLSKGQRKALAFEILELEQLCMKLWKKRDHYLEHGKLPDLTTKEVDIPEDKVQLAMLIENVKKSIRRNRKQMTLHPDKPIYASKYQEYLQLYEKITGKRYDEKN